VGTSSMGNSDTVAHQTMTDDTTVSDTMTDDTTVGNAMADTNDSSGESSSAIVSDFGDISINVVGVVVDMLDPSVRKVDGVMSLPGSSAIVSLLGVKAGSRVVVSHGILVGVGGDLVGVDLSNGMGNWVSNSMTNNSMANTVTENAMADAMASNTMADNAMADAMTNNTMANNAMPESHTMSNGVSDRSNYRGGHCMGCNSMAQSSNNTMANPDPLDPVSDGMGWGGGSNCGSATNPG